MRRAVIDVGTNSVKLLIADVDGCRVEPLVEQSEQTRLGQGFYETHQLQPEPIARTAQAVAAFAGMARRTQVKAVRVIGTSAARDAKNKRELTAALEEASGLSLEIILGEQEAELVFRGVATDPKLQGQSLLILDVGGGSTEFILGAGGHHLFRKSFSLGSLRLLEKLRPGDPPDKEDLAGCRSWLSSFFKEQITPGLAPLFSDGAEGKTCLVGTGGTVTILARMEGKMQTFDRARIDGMLFSRQKVIDWMERLWSVSLAERRQFVGLPPNRADVILTGAAIYEAVMEQIHFEELYASTRGLRFGAILEEAG